MPRILKANTNGLVEVAIPDTDYASVEKEKKLAADAQKSVDNALDSKNNASSSADTAKDFASAATDARDLAIDLKDAAKLSEDAASLASAAATGAVWLIRGIQFITGDIGVEAFSRAVKAAYYAGLATRYSQEANEAVEKVDFRITRLPGIAGTAGAPGAAGVAGIPTLLINSNINININQISNISQSPGSDYDAVSLKFYWDLFNDNVEIIWS